MEILRTKSFERDFSKLPRAVQSRFAKQLGFFIQNPFHPSLRTKKMRGATDIWEVRVTKGYRFSCAMRQQFCILRRIGAHDILRDP